MVLYQFDVNACSVFKMMLGNETLKGQVVNAFANFVKEEYGSRAWENGDVLDVLGESNGDAYLLRYYKVCDKGSVFIVVKESGAGNDVLDKKGRWVIDIQDGDGKVYDGINRLGAVLDEVVVKGLMWFLIYQLGKDAFLISENNEVVKKQNNLGFVNNKPTGGMNGVHARVGNICVKSKNANNDVLVCDIVFEDKLANSVMVSFNYKNGCYPSIEEQFNTDRDYCHLFFKSCVVDDGFPFVAQTWNRSGVFDKRFVNC